MERKIIVVNGEDAGKSCPKKLSWPGDKRIMLDPKKKRQNKPVVEVKEKDSITPLR
jgi:hypothetical protein